jgi:hypothetical protein
MALDQASVKIRSGHPDDDPESGIWTGYLPFQTIVGDPVAQDGVDCPVTPAVHGAKAQWARRLS